MSKYFKKFIIFGLITLISLGLIKSAFLWLIVPFVVIVFIWMYDTRQTRHSLWHNFPVIGRFRWMLEELRPPIRQYFIESDIDGVPFNRQTRGLVYRRSKNMINTIPFGTKEDVYKTGYEWIGHSLKAKKAIELEQDPRVLIGGETCTQPYSSSILNTSAMSFGALSANAILALGNGAKIGGFAFNTGEGGISIYHLQTGADLIWQIGTAYFGCRDKEGKFDKEEFRKKAQLENVKMIEIKLSQGAKPGHGGILPAEKNTPEIAEVRGVKPHTQVDSPPIHSAFSSMIEMMEFIQSLREASGGKPIGFKLSIGKKEEFVEICQAMIESGIKPDFITVDGSEGGTGAAPIEYTNSIGMPLREALVFVIDTLNGFDLKEQIRVVASGKIINGMDMTKVFAIGADLCASARGMMFSLGCIQALQCHKNSCPTGIATQDKNLMNGLNVSDKKQRVANFHQRTVESFVEILASTGMASSRELTRGDIYYRVSQTEYKSYKELFPPVKKGSLLRDF